MLLTFKIGLFFHRLTADSCSVPADKLVIFPLRGHTLHQRDVQTFTLVSSLCGKTHLIVAVIPPAADLTDPAVIRAPGSAAVEVEGDGVVRGGGGVGGDLKINCIVRPRPAAARHARPCAIFRRAVPEVGRVHSQVTFAQLDEIAAGGIQLQGAAGEGHGTVVDAGPGTHRKGAAVYGRPAVQAAFCPGDGHHAAALDRDSAIVDGCGCAVDLQRTINFCTAAGNCIVSVLNDQLAAALDRGTHSVDAVFCVADLHISGNICAHGVYAKAKRIQRNVGISSHFDWYSTTVKSGITVSLCSGHRAFSGDCQLLSGWVDRIIRDGDVSTQGQRPGESIITCLAIVQNIRCVGRGHRRSGNAQITGYPVRRECSRRQCGQSHGCCQKGTEQPQLGGVPEFICHKNILLPPFRCPVRCFFQSASGRRKTGLLFL